MLKYKADFCIKNRRICAFHGKYFSHYLLSPHINWQKLTTLSPSPEPSDWSAVSINTDLYLGTIRSSVNNLINRFQEELKRLYGKGEAASLLWNNRTKSNLLWLCFECKTQNMPDDVVESYQHLVLCVNTSTTISMKSKSIGHKLGQIFNLNCHVWMGCDAK